MNPRWILFESTSRWAPALRLALDRTTIAPADRPRLVEVRGMSMVDEALASPHACLLLAEVRVAELRELLRWLAHVIQRHTDRRVLALVDCSPHEFPAVEAILREVGVIDLTASPRRLQEILALGLRHTQWFRATKHTASAKMAVTSRIWSSLPWQAD